MSEFKFNLNGKDYVSNLTGTQVQEYLTQHFPSGFAVSLVENRIRYGRWTARQGMWAHKLVLDHMQANQPKPEVVEQEQPQQTGPQILLLPTVAAKLELASKKLKRIKLTFKQDGGEVVIKKNRYGTYTVGYAEDNGRWHMVGVLDSTGTLTARKGIPGVFAALDNLEENFEGFVGECGRKAGACCFCRLPLTDKRSTEKGYGPICAGHYGLPWGEK